MLRSRLTGTIFSSSISTFSSFFGSELSFNIFFRFGVSLTKSSSKLGGEDLGFDETGLISEEFSTLFITSFSSVVSLVFFFS